MKYPANSVEFRKQLNQKNMNPGSKIILYKRMTYFVR